MPYTLTFNGSFFQIADFIKGLDSLVKTTNEEVAVDGRLITINGFSLRSDPKRGFPDAGSELLGHHLPDPARTGPHRRRHARRRPEATTATPASTTTGGAP